MQTKTICTKALKNAAAAFVQMMTRRRHRARKQSPVPLEQDRCVIVRLHLSLITLNKLREERMPQYTLRLTHTAQGADPGHPHNVTYRRNQAIAVAKRNNVTGWSGTAIEDGITPLGDGATWKVEGSDFNICGMIAIWTWHKNVTVSGGPHCRP
jgi:hypothetical protein